jgi:hypothetical protein
MELSGYGCTGKSGQGVLFSVGDGLLDGGGVIKDIFRRLAG